jgi:hypothetical protein
MNEQIYKYNKKDISEIMNKIECPNDFECYKKGIENFHNIKIIGLGDVIECTRKNSNNCIYSFSFGYSYFCKCPLLHHLVKKSEK